MRHGEAPSRERLMTIMRLLLAGVFLITLPTGLPLAYGALIFLIVFFSGLAAESFA
jgi:hypothetical protein